MADWRAISTIGRSILGLIEDHYPAGELAGETVEFKLIHPSGFEKPPKTGFTACLYRTAINGTLRTLPPRRAPDGRRYRPSLPVDIHFLVTPWAEDAERQMRLLGWMMRFFEDLPILPAALLNSYAAEPDTFRPEEAAELTFEPLDLGDYLGLWDKLKPKMQASVTYAVRMLSLDSDVELKDAGPAQTRVLQVARVPQVEGAGR